MIEQIRLKTVTGIEYSKASLLKNDKFCLDTHQKFIIGKKKNICPMLYKIIFFFIV